MSFERKNLKPYLDIEIAKMESLMFAREQGKAKEI